METDPGQLLKQRLSDGSLNYFQQTLLLKTSQLFHGYRPRKVEVRAHHVPNLIKTFKIPQIEGVTGEFVHGPIEIIARDWTRRDELEYQKMISCGTASDRNYAQDVYGRNPQNTLLSLFLFYRYFLLISSFSPYTSVYLTTQPDLLCGCCKGGEDLGRHCQSVTSILLEFDPENLDINQIKYWEQLAKQKKYGIYKDRYGVSAPIKNFFGENSFYLVDPNRRVK